MNGKCLKLKNQPPTTNFNKIGNWEKIYLGLRKGKDVKKEVKKKSTENNAKKK